jgi:hypothetical protein
MSEASKLSCIVAHKPFYLERSLLEVTDETDRYITEDIEDAKSKMQDWIVLT